MKSGRKYRLVILLSFHVLMNRNKKIQTRVTALYHFSSFEELYTSLPTEKLGYTPAEAPNPDHMDEYYPREKQEQYGVLGIELYLTDFQKFIDAQDYGYGFGETYQTALAEMQQ